MVYNGCKYVGTCLCKSCDDPCCDHCMSCVLSPGLENPVEQCDRGYSYGDGELVDPLSYLWEDRDEALRNHGKTVVEE